MTMVVFLWCAQLPSLNYVITHLNDNFFNQQLTYQQNNYLYHDLSLKEIKETENLGQKNIDFDYQPTWVALQGSNIFWAG